MIAQFKLSRTVGVSRRPSETALFSIDIQDQDPIRAIECMVDMLGIAKAKLMAERAKAMPTPVDETAFDEDDDV